MRRLSELLGNRFACTFSLRRACRRDAPPGFRATPRADFAVTAIRLQSLTPSRLRRCALRLPPGDRRQAHPRRAWLGAPRYRRTGLRRIGQSSAPPQWAGRDGYAGACCGRLSKCVRSSTLAVLVHRVTKDGVQTRCPALLESPYRVKPWCRRVRWRRSRLSSGCWPGPGRWAGR